MRISESDPRPTRVRHLAWVAVSAALGLLLGWLAAAPLQRFGPGNVLLWIPASIFIARQQGAHLRKWVRLTVLGFVLGATYAGIRTADWSHGVSRTLVILLAGGASAICAIPSGGLIHGVFAWRMHRAARQRQSGR